MRQAGTERLARRGLSAAEVGQFIGRFTGVTPAPDLVAALHTQTDGNPLFLEEYVRGLRGGADAGALLHARSVADLTIPKSLRAVIVRRLAPLSAGCHRALAIAATMGREFDDDVLRRVAVMLDAGASVAPGGVLAEAEA